MDEEEFKLPKFKLPEVNLKNFLTILFCLLLISSYIIIDPDRLLTINKYNKDSTFCNRFAEIYDHKINASVECVKSCWEHYGCSHNATGYLTLGTCLCSGGSLQQYNEIQYPANIGYFVVQENINESKLK